MGLSVTVSKPGSARVVVLDYTKGEVRYVTPEQAREELDTGCRSQGHHFATRYPNVPQPDDRCICGDITFREWGHKSGV